MNDHRPLKTALQALVLGAAVCYALPGTAGDFAIGNPDSLSDDLIEDPLEIAVGDWKLHLEFETGFVHTDNIEDDPVAAKDVVSTNAAGLDIGGELGGVDVSLFGSVDAYAPFGTPSENYLDKNIGVDLRRDFGEHLRGKLRLEASDFRPGYNTEDLDREQIIEAAPELKLSLGVYEVELRGAIGYDRFFGDQTDTRQHKFADLQLLASREIMPDLSAYAGLMLRGTTYDLEFNDDDYRRGNKGYGAFAGLKGDISPKLTGDISVGVVRQEFNEQIWRPLTYASVNGYMQFRPTEKISLSAIGKTEFSESEDYGAAGLFVREGKLRAEYLLTDKTILLVEATQERATYLYADIVEQTTDLEAGLDYAFHNHGILSLRYKHRSRRSDDEDEVFDRNSISASIRIK